MKCWIKCKTCLHIVNVRICMLNEENYTWMYYNTWYIQLLITNLKVFKSTNKESGRIRRRFGRNVVILKRLKNYRRLKRIFDCYSFNSSLEYRKIGKILQKCIWFLQNMILNKAIRSNSYKNRQILLCF